MSELQKLVSETLGGKTRRFRNGKEESPAITQAINFMIQSGPSAIPMGRFNRLYGENKKMQDLKKPGDIRMNVENQRYVKLLRAKVYDDNDPNDPFWLTRSSYLAWCVEDVLTGDIYALKTSNMGYPANEMEVIAWAAK